MASDFTIRAVNDWRGAVHTSMATAARVSMEVWRREGTEATKHLLILMAQSARAMTPQSKQYRPVQHDKHGDYVEVWSHGKASKIYKWMTKKSDADVQRDYARGRAMGRSDARAARMAAAPDWGRVQTIRNRGMAKRSWMWGFGKQHPLQNVAVVERLHNGARVVGYQLTNRLGYIDRIMPAGYQAAAEQKAVNKLMKQAEDKMVKAFEREVGRRGA